MFILRMVQCLEGIECFRRVLYVGRLLKFQTSALLSGRLFLLLELLPQRKYQSGFQ